MSRFPRLLSFGAVSVIALVLVVALSGAVSFGGGSRTEATNEPAPNARTLSTQLQDGTATTEEMSAVEVVNEVSASVVTVLNEQRVSTQNGSALQPVGSGTGFIIDAEGHIVTNWHVVQGGTAFEVVFVDGTTREAELVGSDELSDLAVVRIDGELPDTVSFGDSEALQPGEEVLAIGSPLGAFSNTVTKGVVSAINRDFPYTATGQGGAASQYNNLVQHDAAINPGNSGGPLFNMRGEVIGVNTLGIPVSEDGQPVQGLFFAIPSNTVQEIAQQLIESGRVAYPYMGVSYQTNSPPIAAELDLETSEGAVVTDVPNGGPADEAGLQPGDVILQIGDYPLDAQTTFSEALFKYKPGDTVELRVLRDGEEIETNITFDERPEDL